MLQSEQFLASPTEFLNTVLATILRLSAAAEKLQNKIKTSLSKILFQYACRLQAADKLSRFTEQDFYFFLNTMSYLQDSNPDCILKAKFDTS